MINFLSISLNLQLFVIFEKLFKYSYRYKVYQNCSYLPIPTASRSRYSRCSFSNDRSIFRSWSSNVEISSLELSTFSSSPILWPSCTSSPEMSTVLVVDDPTYPSVPIVPETPGFDSFDRVLNIDFFRSFFYKWNYLKLGYL